MIREEESQTGEKSKRAYDATPSQAAADPEVHKIQTTRKEEEWWGYCSFFCRFQPFINLSVYSSFSVGMAKLKEITDQFLGAIIGSLKKMPFGVRYIGQQLKEIMKLKFPGNEDEVDKIVGNLIYYRYINPAIM